MYGFKKKKKKSVESQFFFLCVHWGPRRGFYHIGGCTSANVKISSSGTGDFGVPHQRVQHDFSHDA